MQSQSMNSQIPQALTGPFLLSGRSAEFNLDQELEALCQSEEWDTGIARKVLVRYPDFEITLRRMKSNVVIPTHHNPGRICVQTVLGHIRMRADGKLFDLPKGSMLVLDRAVTHDVEAVEESAFLLTVALPENVAH
jgi:quercetin dioxygenase-like cupin family protein